MNQKPSTLNCAPIAIINAIKWAGNDDFDDKQMLEQMEIIVNCANPSGKGSASGNGHRGTRHEDITRGLRSRPEFFLCDIIEDPSIKDIKNHIDAGGSVVLSCKNYQKKIRGHAMFIPERYGHSYTIINFTTSDYIRTYVSNKELGRILRASKKATRYQGCAWLLHKRRLQLGAIARA